MECKTLITPLFLVTQIAPPLPNGYQYRAVAMANRIPRLDGEWQVSNVTDHGSKIAETEMPLVDVRELNPPMQLSGRKRWLYADPVSRTSLWVEQEEVQETKSSI